MTRLARLTTVAALLAAVQFTGLAASAHGPTPRKVEETITIDAPPAKVWELAGNFASLADWHPMVASVKENGGNAVDATRDVVLKKGGTLIDSLDEYVPDQMNYSYRLQTPDIEHFPVSFYSATFSVAPADGGKSKVDWIGRFYRADTGNFPAENQNDETAEAAMTEFFKTGLEGLKAKAEGK